MCTTPPFGDYGLDADKHLTAVLGTLSYGPSMALILALSAIKVWGHSPA
jgi:hypothetical protein